MVTCRAEKCSPARNDVFSTDQLRPLTATPAFAPPDPLRTSMNTSVIRYRVADFLKSHAPFDALPAQDLLELAARGRVRFHEAGEYIYTRGQAKTQWVWMLQQGRVELVDESSGEDQLRDVLGEGDLLGLERYLGDGTYLSSARTTTDVVAYAIDATAFESLTARHPAVKRYLAAHFSVSGTGVGRYSWLDAEAPPLEFLRVRQSVSNGSPPVLTAPLTTRSAVRAMIAGGVEELSVDGAVLTTNDLALFCDRNPALLVREIRQADCAAVLAPLLKQGSRMVLDALAHSSDVDDCALIATEMVASAAATCLRLAQHDVAAAGIEPPAGRACWVAFGSTARGELLRMAPPKMGVVYEGDSSAARYFHAVMERASNWVEAIGLDGPPSEWPAGTQPCLSLDGWKSLFSITIAEPHHNGLFNRRDLFDFRALSGDPSLLTALSSHITAEVSRSSMLLGLIANDTVGAQPPLTVFRGLVLGSDGEGRDTLDLEEFIVHPISDAARVFALSKPGAPVNTLARLQAAALDCPGQADVFLHAADAFRIALYHRTLAGTAVIHPSILGKMELRVMKTAFASILRLLELIDSTFVFS